VNEAECSNNTPRWNRAPVDLDQLLTLHGFIGPWPDNLIIDDLTWPGVMARIMNHPAMRAIEKLYRLLPGERPPRLQLPRFRPAKLNSLLMKTYPANDKRRVSWVLQGRTFVFSDWGDGFTKFSVLNWYREQVFWSLLVPIIDQLKARKLVEDEADPAGPLFGSPPVESDPWNDPRMMFDPGTGEFWPEPRRGIDPPAGSLRSYHRVKFRVWSPLTPAVPPGHSALSVPSPDLAAALQVNPDPVLSGEDAQPAPEPSSKVPPAGPGAKEDPAKPTPAGKAWKRPDSLEARIRPELARRAKARAEAGLPEPTAKLEADEIRKWDEDEHPKERRPKDKTVYNAVTRWRSDQRLKAGDQ
jgi:hypothetical protein